MKKWSLAILLIVIGVFFLSLGIYIGQTDDSPGAGGLGMLLMGCFSWGAWRMIRKK